MRVKIKIMDDIKCYDIKERSFYNKYRNKI